MKALPTAFIQIVFEIMLNSKVIFKSMAGPDDTGQVGLKSRA